MNINEIQRLVLDVICNWVKTQNTPIAQKTIVEAVTLTNPIPQSTVRAAVRILVKKRYIRKAVTFESGVSYVQLRSL